PDAASRRVSGVADGRWVASSAIVTTSARFTDFRAGVGKNPLLAAVPADTAAVDEEPRQAARLYTVSAAANLAGQGGWTHTLLAGVDGYRLDYVPNDTGPILMGTEAALMRARGGADRATLRASTSKRLGGEGHASGTVTLAAEHSVLRQATERGPRPGAPPPPPGGSAPPAVVQWLSNSGLLAQAGGAWRDTWFATGGLRFERNDALENGSVAALPMLGAAWVGGLGRGAELKLRAAYGRGIRAPRTPAREHQRTREWSVPVSLEPESQAGVEVGAELYLGSAFRVQATRFDQRATGLAQDVVVGVDTVQQRGQRMERPRYELQNVGAIDNRGWEMQARLERGPLALSTALTLVDSRVRRVASLYTGDLRPGDRMLGVPARTAGLTAEWNTGTWTAALSAERAWDWVNYDRLELAQAWAEAEGPARQALAGARLRDFWRAYDGATDVSGTVTLQVRSGLRLLLAGENLLGSQLGEPDNVTIRAGRTLTFGIRASF
ncbi:MAG TPA: TonB-dependent receptor, partial [Longimicrobium sp.]|nr:TonB-dependent receptor [Longimicrobium sp.]